MRLTGFFIALLLAAVCNQASVGQPARSVSTQRGAPVMRQDIYRQLRAARSCLQDEDLACAASVSAEVFAIDDLNSYERAQAWNFQASLEFARGQPTAALEAYENMLAEADAPAGLVRSAHYAMAQLYLSEGFLDEALGAINRWWGMAQPSAPEPFALRARIQYLRGAYEESLAAIEQAFLMAPDHNRMPEEDWHRMRYGSLLELGRNSDAAEAIEALLQVWPRREYYLELDRLYRESGNERRRRELFDFLYADGRIVDRADLILVAELRLDALRIEAALDVLEQNLDRGSLYDGVALRVLIARVHDWARGEPMDPVECATLLRNARREQEQGEKPRNLRL